MIKLMVIIFQTLLWRKAWRRRRGWECCGSMCVSFVFEKLSIIVLEEEEEASSTNLAAVYTAAHTLAVVLGTVVEGSL